MGTSASCSPPAVTGEVFSCFTHDDWHCVPTLSFLFARNLKRARTLARRQLKETPGAVALEICTADGRLLCVERP